MAIPIINQRKIPIRENTRLTKLASRKLNDTHEVACATTPLHTSENVQVSILFIYKSLIKIDDI